MSEKVSYDELPFISFTTERMGGDFVTHKAEYTCRGKSLAECKKTFMEMIDYVQGLSNK